MNSKKLAKIAYNAINEKKGTDIRILDISQISIMSDYFLLVSGSNRNLVQAIADNVKEKLYKEGFSPRQIEGYQSANWILMDYNDIVVHVFNEEDRSFYNLDKIWLDSKEISPEDL